MVEQQPSKLNTRVRFPSPAPSNFSDLAGTLDLVPTTAKSPSRLQAECLPILPVFSFPRVEISPWRAVISSAHQFLRLVRFRLRNHGRSPPIENEFRCLSVVFKSCRTAACNTHRRVKGLVAVDDLFGMKFA